MASLPASVKIGHIGTSYLHALTDDFSIWQHSKGEEIDLSHGYALDDAARALLAAILYDEKELAQTYLKFLHTACCTFKEPVNFFDAKHKPVNRPLSPDALGETYWAVSVALESGFDAVLIEKIKKRILPYISTSHDLRALGYGVLSHDEYLIQRFQQEFEKAWKQHSSHWWPWPENTLTYGNAIIPLALLSCSPRDKRGFTMLDFLNATCTHQGIPCPIGNEGWYKQGEAKAIFTQQPIDPAYQVWANAMAYVHTRKERAKYTQEARRYLAWFWGWNTAKLPVIDSEKERCADGIHAEGISINHGSECTACYLIAQALYETLSSADSKSAISTLFRPIQRSAAP